MNMNMNMNIWSSFVLKQICSMWKTENKHIYIWWKKTEAMLPLAKLARVFNVVAYVFWVAVCSIINKENGVIWNRNSWLKN